MSLKEEKVLVTSGKKKASVRKETNALSGMRVTDRAQKPEHTAATPSEPSFSRGRSVSKKRSIQGCRQEHLTRDFSHAPCTCDHTHIVARGVSVRIALHPHAIHDVTCLSVRCLSSFCLLSLYLSLLPLLSHCLLVLCPVHQLQCRHRRGLNPLHSRRMRSIAPWRYTISHKGKSNHGASLRQPCRYYLKSTCTRSPCEYWHPPECQFYKTETGYKAGDKCLFPHHKVDENQTKSQRKTIIPTKEEKATTKMLWLL